MSGGLSLSLRRRLLVLQLEEDEHQHSKNQLESQAVEARLHQQLSLAHTNKQPPCAGQVPLEQAPSGQQSKGEEGLEQGVASHEGHPLLPQQEPVCASDAQCIMPSQKSAKMRAAPVEQTDNALAMQAASRQDSGTHMEQDSIQARQETCQQQDALSDALAAAQQLVEAAERNAATNSKMEPGVQGEISRENREEAREEGRVEKEHEAGSSRALEEEQDAAESVFDEAVSAVTNLGSGALEGMVRTEMGAEQLGERREDASTGASAKAEAVKMDEEEGGCTSAVAEGKVDSFDAKTRHGSSQEVLLQALGPELLGQVRLFASAGRHVCLCVS